MTISRELSRAGQAGYRASVAQSMVDAARHRRRPGRVKLLQSPRLRRQVQDYLRLQFSPEQIAGRLRLDYPDDAEMRLSAETIYQALYVQGRGSLREELKVEKALRSGRTSRRPRSPLPPRASNRSWIGAEAHISQRPAEVADRSHAAEQHRR